MLRSDDPWEVIAGIGVTIAGALETALYGLCVALPNIIGGWIKTAAEYVWNGIKVAAEIDQQSRSVMRYFISTDSNVPITGVIGIKRHLFDQLGFLLTAPISESPCEKLVDYLTTYGFDYDASISNMYVPQYYLEGLRILWQFNSTTYNYGFLSPDETAGTRTFSYVAVDLEGDETYTISLETTWLPTYTTISYLEPSPSICSSTPRRRNSTSQRI